MSTAAAQPQTLSFSHDIFAKLSPHPYLLAHLKSSSSSSSSSSSPTRANSRQPTTFRKAHINTGSLTHAEGSTVVRIGDTAVVCGVRAEVLLASNTSAPAGATARELDLLVPNIELATGCSPAFLPGQPPGVLAQSLSTRVYELLQGSRLVDGEDLRIYGAVEGGDGEEAEGAEREVKAYWTLYIDILFISLDGNPFDAAWAAVVSALHNVRLPSAAWDADREMVICSDEVSLSKRLSLRGCPVAVSFAVFSASSSSSTTSSPDGERWLLADPDAFEEGLCDERVSVVLDCGAGKQEQTRILGIEKVGGLFVGREEMRTVVKLAEDRWTQLSGMLLKD